MSESIQEQTAARSKEKATGSEGDRRRKKKLIALLVVSCLFLSVLAVSSNYLVTKKPLPTLPPVQAVTRGIAPQFLFSIYGVSAPMGVVVSPSSQVIYVTEGGGERQIRAFDRAGRQLAVFSVPDSTPSTRNPLYGAVDGQGRLYVTDRARGTIGIFNPEGKFIENFQPGGEEKTLMPLGITFDGGGNLFITEVTDGKHRVMVFNPKGEQLLEFGKQGRAPGDMNFPNGIVVDKKGRIIVSNGNNGRIDVFGSSGELIANIGKGSGTGTVGLPRGMGIDDLDRLFVVDTVSHQVSAYDLSSDTFRFLFSFGKEGMGDGEFSFPNGLAIDRTGRIYVTDRGNNRVQVWAY